MASISESEKTIPIIDSADVVVAGGGPAGFAAAVSAAREGAEVILVERYGYLGGLATAGLVNPILGHTAANSDTPIVEGVLRALVDRMHDLGGAQSWDASLSAWGVNFEAEAFKYAADTMLADSGARIRYHTAAAAVDAESGGEVNALIIESKSGRQAIKGAVFVDATGDADLVAWADVGYTMGRDFDGAVESMGSFVHFGGMTEATPEQLDSAKAKLEDQMREGKFHFYNSHFANPGPRKSAYFAPNMTRFGGDPTSAESLSAGEQSVRKEVWNLLEFLKKQPGLENAFILQTSPCIGPRESRQLLGRYRLTGNDVHTGKRFDDAIARGSWWIDIHCPLGHTFPVHLCTKQCPRERTCPYWVAEHDGEMFDSEDLYAPDGGWYDIPYRSLTSDKAPNLIVAGRSISADHHGMAGARVMGTCMAIGEAAGTAAAMASAAAGGAGDVNVNAVDIPELRRRLKAAGAIV